MSLTNSFDYLMGASIGIFLAELLISIYLICFSFVIFCMGKKLQLVVIGVNG